MPDTGVQNGKASLLPTPIATLLGLFSYASLAYALGYIYQWAYLDVFGATFLISELTPAQALFGTATTVVPLLLIAIVWVGEPDTSLQRPYRRWFLAAIAVAAGVTFIDYGFGRFIRDFVRGVAFLCAGLLALIAAYAAARKFVFDSRVGQYSPHTFLAVVVSAFVLWPAMIGFSRGYVDKADPVQNLPIVRFKTRQGAGYVLLLSHDRIYYVRQPHRTKPSIFVADWSEITEITSERYMHW